MTRVKKIKQPTSFDNGKLFQLLELYMKANPNKYKDDTTYADREYLKDTYPGAVSVISSMPLNMETVKDALKWQEDIQFKYQQFQEANKK